MADETAPRLFEDLEVPGEALQPSAAEGGVPCHLKLRTANRRQLKTVVLDVEQLIPETHKARAIWHLTGKLDLSRFYQGLCGVEGGRGRAAWDPRLLVSVWVYALSEGVSSTREIEKRMEWEPGLMWLGGTEAVNHTTLNNFRQAHGEALRELFAQLLALLEQAGLMSLERVMHDGTKIEAQAGSDTFRREKTVRERLAKARELVRRLEQEPEGERKGRQEAARERALREQHGRLEKALEELQRLQAQQPEKEQAQVRVSLSDPEARIMKHGDQAIGPAYNLQITTDAKEKVIVGMQVNQCSSDAPALEQALAEVEQGLGRLPRQVVVDGGYTTQDNVILAAEREIDLIGSLGDQERRVANALKSAGIAAEFGPSAFVQMEGKKSLRCPAGKELAYVGQSQKKHRRCAQYRAQASDCGACALRSQCCAKSRGKGRMVSKVVQEHEALRRFRQKMQQAEAQQIYKQRGPVAEFPNAWIKDKIKLWKFRLRGLKKAATEALWACFTYNVMVWERLVWREKRFTAAA
jgi:transposase